MAGKTIPSRALGKNFASVIIITGKLQRSREILTGHHGPLVPFLVRTMPPCACRLPVARVGSMNCTLVPELFHLSIWHGFVVMVTPLPQLVVNHLLRTAMRYASYLKVDCEL